MEDQRVGLVLDDRYRIEERVAAGGTGVVYRATQLGLGRLVAIKFLHQSSAASEVHQGRFKREAAAMSRIGHPNVAAIIDFGSHEGSMYLVMELYEGTTLRTVLDEGPIEPRRAIHIVRQVLAGLAKAHDAKVVHRDLKPSNVLLVDSLGSDHVKILDFGVAKLTAGEGPTEVSIAAGRPLGTPQYMSPEQAKAEPVDARSDLYSLGVVLYEMTTGARPFEAGVGFALLRKQVEDEPTAPRELRPMSEELEAVILRAMRKAPEERFQSAAEMADALAQVPEVSQRKGRGGKGRWRLPLALLGLLGLLAAGGAYGAWRGWVPLPSWSPWQPGAESQGSPAATEEEEDGALAALADAGQPVAARLELPPWTPEPAEVELAARPERVSSGRPGVTATVAGEAIDIAAAELVLRGAGGTLQLYDAERPRACDAAESHSGQRLELPLASARPRRALRGGADEPWSLVDDSGRTALASDWQLRILDRNDAAGTARLQLRVRGYELSLAGTFAATLCPDPRALSTPPPVVSGLPWDPDRAPDPDSLPEAELTGAFGDRELEVVAAHLTSAEDPPRVILSFFAEPPVRDCADLGESDVGAVVELPPSVLQEGYAHSAALEPTRDSDGSTLPRIGIHVPSPRTHVRDASILTIHIDSVLDGEIRGRIYLAVDDIDRTLLTGAFRARDCR